MLKTQTAMEAAKESQVSLELGILKTVVNQYGDNLEALETRLMPIRNRTPLIPKDEEKKEVPERLVPLAEEIRAIREKVETLNMNLSVLISELEI